MGVSRPARRASADRRADHARPDRAAPSQGAPHLLTEPDGAAERTLRSTRAFEGRLISLRVDEVERNDGGRATREIVEHPGAVAVVAWDGRRIAMVRQWRHAAADTLLEIPAGTSEPDEDPLTTARRELAEEMGIGARSWIAGPSFFTAPGFCTERLTLFLATDLYADDTPAPDDERIERAWLSLDEALETVDRGQVVDAKSIAGILWLARRLAAAG